MEYTAESYHEPQPRNRIRTNLARWFVVLAGPAAWLLSLNLGFSLVQVACAEQTFFPMHLVSAATLVIALFGGYVGLLEWRSVDRGWPNEGGTVIARHRFMSALGLLNSGLFSVVIFGQWMANLFLNPCMGI